MEKIEKTEEEWREELSPEQYEILRKHGTERPFTGKYVDTKADGTYCCAACGNELFSLCAVDDRNWRELADDCGGLTSSKAALDLAMPAAAMFSPSREITSRSAFSAPLFRQVSELHRAEATASEPRSPGPLRARFRRRSLRSATTHSAPANHRTSFARPRHRDG
jgi:hypothetical protein